MSVWDVHQLGLLGSAAVLWGPRGSHPRGSQDGTGVQRGPWYTRDDITGGRNLTVFLSLRYAGPRHAHSFI